MADELFVINNGEIIITPYYGRVCDKWGDCNPVNNITVNLGKEYRKLRGIEMDHTSEVKRRVGKTFNPALWLKCGTGESEILINKIQLNYALARIKDATRIKKVRGILNKSNQVTSQIKRTNNCGKITCVMNPEGNLEIVSQELARKGSLKIIKKTDVLWKIDTSLATDLGITFAVAKPKKGNNSKEAKFLNERILNEVNISKTLIGKGVPRVLRYHKIARNDSNKNGLMMEYCPEGNLRDYISGHFDTSTHTVLPQYRKQHINFMRQLAETLCEMHKKTGFIHCDIKARNILIKMTPTGPEARLSDFDIAMQKSTFSRDIPGTYPPPELNFAVKNDNKIQITEAIDAWAFGVLFVEMILQNFKVTNQLLSTKTIEEMEEARKTIVEKILDHKNPVDQIIMQLLAKDPSKRITLEQAKDLLAQV